ncbi:uncharacterized protein LOC131151775 isoform X1 [Malania oleifera]|uniref:uncharacterized protein LOC131151775 isoform X1 n=1 Tax=Malania oleifera TaxID=397392 RepID=UPI0025AE3E1C|nr:uncharacterized protein LOC131151775 isoform X1 [Malania oleifera]
MEGNRDFDWNSRRVAFGKKCGSKVTQGSENFEEGLGFVRSRRAEDDADVSSVDSTLKTPPTKQCKGKRNPNITAEPEISRLEDLPQCWDLQLWKTIGLGRLYNGLYYLIPFSDGSCSMSSDVKAHSLNNAHQLFDLWLQQLDFGSFEIIALYPAGIQN